jgi:hypothetical protein
MITNPGTAPNLTFSAGEGRLHVEARAITLNDGMVVVVSGGDSSHIGAVGIGVPRPSQADPSKRSSTSSVFTLTGHQEDELAKYWAGKLAERLGSPVVVVAGIHIEKASQSEVAVLSANSHIVLEALEAAL